MGYLKSVGTSIIYIGTILAAITFIPGIPPYAKFEEYSIVEPKELENKLAINERLSNAEILFQGEVKGAEAFASYDGELYTGIHGGYVVKVTKDKLIPIVKFGKDCDGIWQESQCGRPLGLKFDTKGSLYVCDGYYGIFKVDVKTGKYEKLVDSKEPIEGKVPMTVNTLDIASNGDIYWSDSSTEFTIQDGVYTMLTNPSGRLIKYNAATKKNHVLLHDLGFANGVALSKDESFVIVLETMMSRIIKYNIKGPKAGKQEIFVEGLPGMPDNIHSDNSNGFLVSLIVYADSQHPQLSQSIMPHPYIRRLAARLLAILESPFKCLQSYYPNYYAEKVIHYIGGFESMLLLTPKTVAVLRINEKGEIIDAAYTNDGNISSISSAFIHDGFLWLGSPFNEYIARVPLKQAFPDLAIKNQNIPNKGKSKETVTKSPTQKPSTTTTPKPTTTTTPKPTTTTTPKPTTTTTPKPTTTTTSKPTTTTPKPTTTTPKPTTTTTPKPTTTTPKPTTTTTPKPKTTTQKSTTTTTPKPSTQSSNSKETRTTKKPSNDKKSSQDNVKNSL